MGTEEYYFIADSGEGADVCRIGVTLASEASRTDCDWCDWAFDLVIDDATLMAEDEPGCEATLGISSDAVSSLNGTTVSYGYCSDYYGHAKVFFVEIDGVWTAVANASWDEKTETFSYDWQSGFAAY